MKPSRLGGSSGGFGELEDEAMMIARDMGAVVSGDREIKER
jgi:hypothetical protein